MAKVKQLEGDQLLLRLGTLKVWPPSTPGAVSLNNKLKFTSHREI